MTTKEQQALDAARYIYIREYIYLRSIDCDADFIKLISMNSKDFDAEVDSQMEMYPKGKKRVFHQCDEEGARQQYASRMEAV